MNFKTREINGKKYIELISTTKPIREENDVLDLIALSWENDTKAFMIDHLALSEDFFKLKTKVAGNIIQKFKLWCKGCCYCSCRINSKR